VTSLVRSWPVVLLAAPAAAAPARLEVDAVGDADQLQVRIRGDRDALGGRETVVGADRVIRIWLRGAALPSTRSYDVGPAERVAVRRLGSRTVVSIHTRADAVTQARRLRFLEEEGTLTAALFAEDGALAGWIAAHAGARVAAVPLRRAPRPAPRVARRAKVTRRPEVVVGTPDAAATEAQGKPREAAASWFARTADAATAAVTAPPVAAPLPTHPAVLGTTAAAVTPPAPPVRAAPPPRRAPTQAPRPFADTGPLRLTLLTALLALCAAVLLLRRRGRRMPGADLAIRVLSSRGLGGKHRVSVIEVGADRFLVAVDTAGTHLISRLAAAGDVAPAAIPVAPAETNDEEAPRLRLVAPPAEGRDAAARSAPTQARAPAANRTPDGPRAASVPLGRLATPASATLPASRRPAAMTALHPGAAGRPTRFVPEPPCVAGASPSPTGPTVHVPLNEVAEDSDVAGLLRLKSSWRRAA
jgi:flagellar biogenesis protein FliO